RVTKGERVEWPGASHAAGPVRVPEVASRPADPGYDVIGTVQGDEPFIEEEPVAEAARLVIEGWPIGTVATPIRTLEALRDPAVVKVVRRDDGGALYFSRAPIPFCRDREPTPAELASGRYLRHLGVYAYSPAALARLVSLPPAELEEIERLEQLRAPARVSALGVGGAA